jgi:hypothetical protein
MGTRSRANAERRRERRNEHDLQYGHSCKSDKTTIEVCMDRIVARTIEALKIKDLIKQQDIVVHLTAKEPLDLKYERLKGEINGMVWMYCYNWVNPYEPHLTTAIKSVRQEAVKRARAQMASESNG